MKLYEWVNYSLRLRPIKLVSAFPKVNPVLANTVLLIAAESNQPSELSHFVQRGNYWRTN